MGKTKGREYSGEESGFLGGTNKDLMEDVGGMSKKTEELLKLKVENNKNEE